MGFRHPLLRGLCSCRALAEDENRVTVVQHLKLRWCAGEAAMDFRAGWVKPAPTLGLQKLAGMKVVGKIVDSQSGESVTKKAVTCRL